MQTFSCPFKKVDEVESFLKKTKEDLEAKKLNFKDMKIIQRLSDYHGNVMASGMVIIIAE